MWLLLLGLLTASAQPASAQTPSTQAAAPKAQRPPPARTVNFEVTGMVVNVTRSDGAAWDIGATSASRGLFQELASLAMGGDAWAAVAAKVAAGAGAAMSRPDLAVTVEVLDAGVPRVARRLAVMADTHQPSWSGTLIRDVPARDNVSVRLTVMDDDFENDDPVGVMVFPASHLLAVARKGGVVWTSTADQTQGTVLYVGVTAWIASP